jgi:hypothetical protein
LREQAKKCVESIYATKMTYIKVDPIGQGQRKFRPSLGIDLVEVHFLLGLPN